MGISLNFDASQVAPNNGSDAPLPEGWYAAVIESVEGKQTNDKQGAYVALKFRVISDEMKGQTSVRRLNLMNQNAQAVAIAQGQLSAICHAIGRLQIGNSDELLNQPMVIYVKARASSGFDDKGKPYPPNSEPERFFPPTHVPPNGKFGPLPNQPQFETPAGPGAGMSGTPPFLGAFSQPPQTAQAPQQPAGGFGAAPQPWAQPQPAQAPAAAPAQPSFTPPPSFGQPQQQAAQAAQAPAQAPASATPPPWMQGGAQQPAQTQQPPWVK